MTRLLYVELEKPTPPIRVLLVEDSPVDSRLLRSVFARTEAAEFDLTTVTRFSDAVSVLNREGFDVILLDLFLEDTAGLETLSRMRTAAPEIPIVVLTGLDDEAQALQALKHGAQDYLIKGAADSRALFRAIRYAIGRGQAEAECRLLQQKLVEGQKLEALGTLAGGVAHNFNNALMVILGHTGLLLEQPIDDGSKRNLEAIKKAGDKAAVLIRQLLTFSRRRNAAEATVASLNKIVGDMQMLLESVLRDGIELDVQLSPDGGAVKADPSQIQQVIMNLVLNARDALGPGGRISVRTELTKSKGRPAVMLTVSDNGSGMNTETRAHIFEPFFTTKGMTHATGLGLSTVYGIVSQYEGTIEVTSAPDAGTTVSVVLPQFGVPAEPAAIREAPHHPSASMLKGASLLEAREDGLAGRQLRKNVPQSKRSGQSMEDPMPTQSDFMDERKADSTTHEPSSAPDSREVMDFEAFRDRAGNDAELIGELIDLFALDYPRQLTLVRSAVESGDASALRSSAHSIKGAVANFSAGPAVQAAASLERMGQTGDLTGAASGCEVLVRELDRLHDVLVETARLAAV